jgi:hypothetical protein
MGRDELVNLLKSKMSEISKLNVEKNKIKKFLDHTFKSDIDSIPDNLYDATKEQVDLIFKNKIKDVSLRSEISEKIINWLSQISLLKFNPKTDVYLNQYSYLEISNYLLSSNEYGNTKYLPKREKVFKSYFDNNRMIMDFLRNRLITLNVKVNYTNGEFKVTSKLIDEDLFYTEIDSLFHLFDNLKIKISIEIDGYHKYNREKIEIGFTKISDNQFRVSSDSFCTYDKKALKNINEFMVLYIKSMYFGIKDRISNYNNLTPGSGYFVQSLMTDKSYQTGYHKFINYDTEDTLKFDNFSMEISKNPYHHHCLKMD